MCYQVTANVSGHRILNGFYFLYFIVFTQITIWAIIFILQMRKQRLRKNKQPSKEEEHRACEVLAFTHKSCFYKRSTRFTLTFPTLCQVTRMYYHKCLSEKQI